MYCMYIAYVFENSKLRHAKWHDNKMPKKKLYTRTWRKLETG